MKCRLILIVVACALFSIMGSAHADSNQTDDIFTSTARIVPNFRNGKPIGFKLFSISPEDILAKIGLKNGDVVMRINGITVDSPDKALEAYERSKRLSRFVVAILRRGQEQTLVVNLADFRQK